MFTPGPWYVECKGKDLLVKYRDNNCTDPVICTMESDVLFDRPNPNTSELANASLVAAAPEMYNMLAKLSAMLTDINAHVAVAEIEALLRKADGTHSIKQPTLSLLNKAYDGEGLHDVGRDVSEAFDAKFNKVVEQIPVDEYGFQRGVFTVSVKWSLS